MLSPINAAGNIPTSDKTEYRPLIKSLCSIISALNLSAILFKTLSFISVIKINLFLNRDFEKTTLKFAIVSSVFPDFETIIKQEFFKILILLNCKCKFSSKLSKKKY